MLTEDFTDKFDGLIFDCDGTLSHSMPLHYVAWRETMQTYGIAFPEGQFYSMGGMPSEKIIAVLSEQQGIDVDSDEAAVKKEARFAELIDQLTTLDAVVDVARRHHGKLPMAVASGGIRPIIDRQLAKMGITELFGSIVTAEDTEKHKPEPDVFLEAARQLGVDPTKCLVFEDSPLGFEAAEKAGMKWIDVRPFYPAG
ncbi:HAD family hydrolase [Rubripirellula reticaptiva]|uniref:Fructose-1-phosphate phosphatase YqaB n=1 Tax=Rubripirellula reticaptiva TaxID=2528013 RepID=A0A5C6EPI7_9BACT|nr:HAD family phosphatase [Rubripirellula reticaptiva]TWU51643.1 Fructose-1-phosphate phosphatase YqaB [Rubripirellula reticaptiva]